MLTNTCTNRFLTPSQPLERTKLSAWEVHQVRICACQQCPRLLTFRKYVELRNRHTLPAGQNWNKPVPGFGDPFARLMVVGLSPSLNGSNRTGRIFTGDASGDLLFENLYRFGFAIYPFSHEFGDNNYLQDVFITSIARCAAPKNRPLLAELDACQLFLQEEIKLLERLQGIITLGHTAFDRVLTILRMENAELPPVKFQHGALFRPGKGLPWILCSYHPSPKNTKIDHPKSDIFGTIWQKARQLLKDG
ncbi:MAG: uracil-DNA glycosylase family protein [Anaerolineaceae bacterium]|nr:uracil-DNA glycosylase family protein [Anaerolineaceae bacterium]